MIFRVVELVDQSVPMPWATGAEQEALRLVMGEVQMASHTTVKTEVVEPIQFRVP